VGVLPHHLSLNPTEDLPHYIVRDGKERLYLIEKRGGTSPPS